MESLSITKTAVILCSEQEVETVDTPVFNHSETDIKTSEPAFMELTLHTEAYKCCAFF